jgi:hypothetical protein
VVSSHRLHPTSEIIALFFTIFLITFYCTNLMEREISEIQIKSAVHSLAILISLRSQKIQNDFKLMFTCLCISFGAGCRFIGMLNHLGLTVSC